MSQTFQPTFLQRFLGKNYKWWYIILFNFKSQRAYIGDTLFWTLYTFVYTAGIFGVWWLTTNQNPSFETSYILTYLYFGSLLGSLTSNWANRNIGWKNLDGSFTRHLLYPTDYFWYEKVMYVGRQILANFPIQILSLVCLYPFIWKYVILNFNINLFYTIIFIPIAYLIHFYLNFAFGCVTFWVTETGGANEFYGYFRDFFKGGVIPLSLISAYIPNIQLNPFAWILHHPMQIYLGKYDNVQTSWTLLGGLAWCIVLYILAKIVFKMGLKRNESVGL